jgi:tetratricopeptide (TPR) repeat protein
MKEGEFNEARSKYEEALEVYPDDKIVLKKLTNLDKEAGQSRQNKGLYDEAIIEADQLFAAGDYISARAQYVRASDYMPQNNYPKEKVVSIDKIVQEQQDSRQAELNKEKEYTDLISRANLAFTAKNYVAAKELYQQSLTVKPSSVFAQQKISELEPLILKQHQDQISKASADNAYSESMAKGQAAMQLGDFETAKQHFNTALQLKPDQSLPQQKIGEANRGIEAKYLADMQAQKAFSKKKLEAMLDEGDSFYAQKDFSAAEKAYLAALDIDPNDTYAKQRLNKTRNYIATAEAEKQQQLEKNFKTTVSAGDGLMAAGSYQQAVEVYKQALIQKPGDASLLTKLSEAENKITSQNQMARDEQVKRKQFDDLLVQGNGFLTQNLYQQALAAYEKAANLYPSQAEPQAKIREIEGILARQQKESQYTNFIIRADQFLAAQDYEQARINYQQALAVKSADSYAQQKISEINSAINENKKRMGEEVAKKRQYDALIAEADRMYSASQFEDSRAKYLQAQVLFPAEMHPRNQVEKIDVSLAERQRSENEQRAKLEQYDKLIATANEQFAAGNLTISRQSYQQALQLNPGESYPRQKIEEIDSQIQKQAELASAREADKKQYSSLITEADRLFAASRLEAARTNYQQALTIMPGEAYPKSQLTRIETITQEKAKEDAEKIATEQKYKNAVELADRLYIQQNLPESKKQYQLALTIKPGESYPGAQITKIDGQLARIEKERLDKQAFEENYTALIALADADFEKRNYPAAKSRYSQVLQMKPSENYPQQQLNKIAEFERIIAKQEADRQAAITAAAATPAQPKASKLQALNFTTDSERDKYLNELKKEYPAGVSKETHKEGNSVTERYVVIRDNEAREFRKVKFSWGGVEYTLNGKPITSQYFDTQVKVREGEFFKESAF